MIGDERAERGHALLMTIVVAIAIAGLGTSLLSVASMEHNAVQGTLQRERAQEAAESGLDLALFELENEIDLGTDGIGVASGQINGGRYAIAIDPPFTPAGKLYTVRAAGRFESERSGIEAVVGERPSFFLKGVFSETEVNLNGNFAVDSYDSSKGTYASQLTGGGFARANGGVGCNQDITLGPNTAIHGDATPGPDGQVIGSGLVSGSTAPAPAEFHFAPPVYDPPIPSAGGFPGGNVTLTPGSYRYASVSLAGNRKLSIQGQVTLYVDGDFKTAGNAQVVILPGGALILHHGSGAFQVGGNGIINQTETPLDVQIYSATTADFKMHGNGGFYGVVYAPRAGLDVVGNGDLYGAVIAMAAKFTGNGKIHYDEALASAALLRARPRFEVRMWRESALAP
ncbi:MAG: hypothetical protein JXQ29_02345 [Planctomycetes bacterium]|nr:hypothetical protein [Planctomycetota bacterium]